MQLVEQHVIDHNDPRFGVIDSAAFASKNLYNAANYRLRQEFIFQHRYISYPELARTMKDTEEYKALPAKVAQQVLITLDTNWQSFFAASRESKEHPEKFSSRPQLPKYKDKQKGRNLLIYTRQAISKPGLERGVILPSQLPIEIQTKQQPVDQVRIVPKKTHYVVEVIYTADEKKAPVDSSLVAGIDIGVNNLAADKAETAYRIRGFCLIASNKPGFVPFLVNGRSLKSHNQFYNKARARLQSQLDAKELGTSRRIDRLTDKRNRKITHELHLASRSVIAHLVDEGIGTLVIGKNPNWKQEANLSKRNNQNFVQIPHARFVQMLTYKAQLVGIEVLFTEESYTSKCSFLDLEPIEKHETYRGLRISRGLFRASDGRIINADINGALNIIRKVVPNAFADGIEGGVVRPLRVICKCG